MEGHGHSRGESCGMLVRADITEEYGEVMEYSIEEEKTPRIGDFQKLRESTKGKISPSTNYGPKGWEYGLFMPITKIKTCNLVCL